MCLMLPSVLCGRRRFQVPYSGTLFNLYNSNLQKQNNPQGSPGCLCFCSGYRKASCRCNDKCANGKRSPLVCQTCDRPEPTLPRCGACTCLGVGHRQAFQKRCNRGIFSRPIFLRKRGFLETILQPFLICTRPTPVQQSGRVSSPS